MTAPALKLTFNRRAWSVPSEDRAPEGWLEGNPSEVQRQAAFACARRERIAWKPDAQAWDQLVQLQGFVGQHVRVQFWNPVMYLLDEGPHPVEAQCEGVVTLLDDGHIQAFLLLRDPVEVEIGGCSGLSYLVEHRALNCKLAPVAELYEVETLPEDA